MNILNAIIEALEEMGTPVKEDGFVSIPNKHRYAVWSNTESRADGSDGYGLFWEHTIVFNLYFKGRRTEEDRNAERHIEKILRETGSFVRQRKYNSDVEADVTSYSFEIYTDFEEEIRYEG